MAEIRIDHLVKAFGEQTVIHDISLAVAEQEFCVFVGPSGCGKSTLLRLIAGLEEVTSGRILIGGKDVTDLEPYDRHLSMVFQSYALYPHMNVRDNMAFALRTAKMPEDLIARKVSEAARILQLRAFLDRRPSALSGGQRQRVAIGRAIVREPLAFLFDEPLSNLDASLRAEMRMEIASLHRTLNSTTIYVTHDQSEAMTLADRIVVLNGGRVMQTGSPVELYEKPANVFVAQFLGTPKMTILDAQYDGGSLNLPGQAKIGLRLDIMPQAIRLGIRPEAISLADPGKGLFDGRVLLNEFNGGTRTLVVRIGSSELITLQVPSSECPRIGEIVGLRCRVEDFHIFRSEGLRLKFDGSHQDQDH